MKRKSNLDWYLDYLTVIEDTFGAKWLVKKSRNIDPRSSSHPIVQLWARAKLLINEAAVTGRLDLNSDFASFFDLAADLRTARVLPGYDKAIDIKRLKSVDWEKDCYVAHVAALGVQSGYAVEFLLPSVVSGEQTADLLMRHATREFYVECKKKDAYLKSENAAKSWAGLQDRLLALQETVACDYEVVVICIGLLNSESVGEIERHVEKIVRQGGEGEFSGGVPDCVVLVKKAPPRPPGVQGAWIPAWQNPGAVSLKVTVGQDGNPTYGPMLRCALYLIDAHRLTQVLNSFRDARPQIPREGTGLIYINVDTTGVRLGDHEIYFRTLSEWIRRQFAPEANSRVAAVVLTGGVASVEITPDRGFHRTLRYKIKGQV